MRFVISAAWISRLRGRNPSLKALERVSTRWVSTKRPSSRRWRLRGSSFRTKSSLSSPSESLSNFGWEGPALPPLRFRSVRFSSEEEG